MLFHSFRETRLDWRLSTSQAQKSCSSKGHDKTEDAIATMQGLCKVDRSPGFVLVSMDVPCASSSALYH
jgi:hypothetical protein